MATPVVTVASGGLAVVDVTATSPKLGLPVTEALNGRGMPVTKVAGGGMPVTFSTVADYPPGGGSTSAEAAAFLARTSGLDATHTSAYTALINGLVTDGVWSKFDVLYIFATQDTATARLNLISSSFAGVLNGSPTFTPDRGYTGVDASGTIYINTQFNPTIGSPKFVRNSSHVSAWSNTNTTSSSGGGYIIGSSDGSNISGIAPRYSNGNSYYGVTGDTSGVLPNANSTGHYLCTRSDGTTMDGYKNKVAVFSGIGVNSVAVLNQSFAVLAVNGGAGGIVQGSACQVTMASIGSGLSSTDVTKFYDRLRTFMTAVGLP